MVRTFRSALRSQTERTENSDKVLKKWAKTADQWFMHRNVIQIANAKGGVGKTSLTANLAGILAAAGWRVLCVDLDPQGNLSRHLGALHRSDGGASLASSIRSGSPVKPITGVRPGIELDLVASGAEWAHEVASGRLDPTALDQALLGVASLYDVVLLDCPPGEEGVQRMAGTAARFLLIPTAMNDSAIDGLAGTFARAVSLRAEANPDLQVLGIVIFGVPSRASAWKARVRTEILQLVDGSEIPVFEQSIRDVPATAAAIEHAGVLVHEAEELAAAQRPWWSKTKDQEPSSRLSIETVRGLADDYLALAREVQQVLLAELEPVG